MTESTTPALACTRSAAPDRHPECRSHPPGQPARHPFAVRRGWAGWITARGADYNYDYAAVAYDAVTGARLGVARFDSGYDDLGYDVAVSPDGTQLLMTGRVGLGGDYGTIAFSLGP